MESYGLTTISMAKKRCVSCGKAMWKWGVCASGKIRWRCPSCKATGVRTRNDQEVKKKCSLFLGWATSKATLEGAAKNAGVHERTLRRWFDGVWNEVPAPEPVATTPRVLVLDGTVLRRDELTILIASDGNGRCVSWKGVRRENEEAWSGFLRPLVPSGAPTYVVCDGQKGLLKAVRETFPSCLVQRCITHVARRAQSLLTLRPKTPQGRELLALVRTLTKVRTRRQKRRWVRSFHAWKRRTHGFLKEKARSSSGRGWYVHRNLRAVRSLLTYAGHDLFRYVRGASCPRTSNDVEGGMNARLKELLRCHRGMDLGKQEILCCLYLKSRKERRLKKNKKPTRNVH